MSDVTIEERTVAVGGMPISYPRAGEGLTLVLLHGAGDNSLDGHWMPPALARKHRVYAPDLPGSDDSAKPVSDHSSAFFEQFVAAFVRGGEDDRSEGTPRASWARVARFAGRSKRTEE